MTASRKKNWQKRLLRGDFALEMHFQVFHFQLFRFQIFRGAHPEISFFCDVFSGRSPEKKALAVGLGKLVL